MKLANGGLQSVLLLLRLLRSTLQLYVIEPQLLNYTLVRSTPAQHEWNSRQ